MELKTLRDCYDYVVNMIKSYVDIDKKYLPILGTWIIGTYFHEVFESYPYIYLNATKGGGKTRTLKLCAFLSKNGSLDVNLTEAVLFRMAMSKVSFFIDELEGVGKKERGNLRLLLNAAYKKGVGVQRARKDPKTESYTVDRFEVFTPIMMANIWGLDNVLQDRCITIILEKSYNPGIVKKIELWRYDKCARVFRNVMEGYRKELFLSINDIESDVSDVTFIPGILYSVFPVFWNIIMNSIIILNNNITTSITSITSQTTQHLNYNDTIHSVMWAGNKIGDATTPSIEITNELYELGQKIWDSEISGRDLELFLPLIMIAHEVGEDILEDLINSAKQITQDQRTEDISENRDTYLIQLLVSMEDTNEWIPIRDITKDFKETEQFDWINNRWVGRALRRLAIRTSQRHTSKGSEVILDWKKIYRKARMLGVDVETVKTAQKDNQKTIDDVVDSINLGVPDALKKRGSR